jgi:type IV pilus assembly protein PilY1
MKSTRQISTTLLILALGSAYPASAEDIDIFLENPDVTGARPNVLLMLDNAASNNSSITMLDGVTSGDKLEMLRQVLNNIVDPLNSPYFPTCTVTAQADGTELRNPVDCITRSEVSDLLEDINLGLMIANPSGTDKGGYVRYHVRPMDVAANRTSLVAKINPGIPQANNAPYAKSMHEAYLYYGGKLDYAGFDSNQYDPAAKSSLNYVSPANDSCQDNYILFVGNGGPDSGEENDTKALLNNIGGVLVTDPLQFTPSNLTSSWFDEYARTLKKQDVVPGVDGIQNVTTYTIAVQNPADNSYNTNTMKSARSLLKSAATQGGGEYFEAHNGQQVMKAFVDMLRKFQPEESVFAASTLPVSVNVRGSYLNQVYMGQFRPDPDAGPRWPGNLKQYQIALDANGNPMLADVDENGVEDTVNGFIKSTVTSFWSTASNYWGFDPMGNPKTDSDAPDGNIVEKGGAAQRLRQVFATSQADRNLYTCNGACVAGDELSTTLFATTNSGITAGLLGAADAAERTSLINWVRGADNKDNEDGNGVSTDIRARIHGDLLHSRPAVVNYNRNGDDRDIVIYYGTNGGIFHAVKGGQDNADGYEKWGMVFPEFLGRLKRLRDNSPDISTATPKPYFADGSVSVYQKDANDDGKLVATDNDKVYLFVGMRRGGRFAYALDVSDPDHPKHLWKIDNSTTGFAELGQTWSSLRPARINASTDPVVIFGAGYDPENEDQLPATANDKGRGIFVVNGRTGGLIKHINPAGMASVPGDVAVVDRDEDGNFDRIYAADTKGNIWRVDINDADSDAWTSYKLAALGGSGADGRKFLNKADVVFGDAYDAVLIGSGDREHPFENTVVNRFYMLKDTQVGLSGDLVCDTDGTPRTCTESDLVDVTSNPFQNADASIERGWYLTLEAGEKVVGNATTVFGTTFFGTNRPIPPEEGSCASNLGEARFYAVGFEAGTATQDFNSDGTLDSSDRFKVIAGGGFPPSPVSARTEVDGKTVDIVTSGSTVITPEGGSFTTERFRTYWYIEQ